MSRLSPPPAPRCEWAYFFDIDGTLIELADSPDGVRVSEDVRRQLEELHDCAGGAVALISGRAIADIDALFPHARMPVAGQHGLERRTAGGAIERHAFPMERFHQARARLVAGITGKPGLLLEDKGASLAIHYRRAPRLASYVHRLAGSLLPVLGPEFCLQRGKRILEVKPAGKDKGVSVTEFMEEPPFRGRTAVFVGDDATDEYGFATVNRLGGYSIKVGAGRTVAKWRLRDVTAVREWLEKAGPCND